MKKVQLTGYLFFCFDFAMCESPIFVSAEYEADVMSATTIPSENILGWSRKGKSYLTRAPIKVATGGNRGLLA